MKPPPQAPAPKPPPQAPAPLPLLILVFALAFSLLTGATGLRRHVRRPPAWVADPDSNPPPPCRADDSDDFPSSFRPPTGIHLGLGTAPLPRHPGPPDPTTPDGLASAGFVIVVSTTSDRPGAAAASLSAHASCPGVRGALIVHDGPSAPSVAKLRTEGNVPVSVPLHVASHPYRRSLRHRFRPHAMLRMAPALFSVDDDIIVPCDALSIAHRAWADTGGAAPVGFFPRFLTTTEVATTAAENEADDRADEGGASTCAIGNEANPLPQLGPLAPLGLLAANLRGLPYNAVLTKAAFLHRDLFSIFSQRLPPSLGSLIDRERNCEDLAMAFVAASVYGVAPLAMPAPYRDEGSRWALSLGDDDGAGGGAGAGAGAGTGAGSGGIGARWAGQWWSPSTALSARPGHGEVRRRCVAALVEAFGGSPLLERRLGRDEGPERGEGEGGRGQRGNGDTVTVAPLP